MMIINTVITLVLQIIKINMKFYWSLKLKFTEIWTGLDVWQFLRSQITELFFQLLF